ncbi:MAG: hypothetical protein LKI24_01290 [Acidipropionibacterium sp.]|nr:hypothetical protein [Acidipropionibacterium sp.]
MQDRSTRATGIGDSVPEQASSRVTLPAGWGAGYPEDREKAVRVRPSQQIDAPTTVHPLVSAPRQDDPLGIYRSAGAPCPYPVASLRDRDGTAGGTTGPRRRRAGSWRP